MCTWTDRQDTETRKQATTVIRHTTLHYIHYCTYTIGKAVRSITKLLLYNCKSWASNYPGPYSTVNNSRTVQYNTWEGTRLYCSRFYPYAKTETGFYGPYFFRSYGIGMRIMTHL